MERGRGSADRLPRAPVGRENDVAAARAVLARRSGVVVVEGEAGIGKSTVCQAAVEAADGTRRLDVQALAEEEHLGYAGLATLLTHVPGSIIAGLPDPQRDALEGTVLLRRRATPVDARAVGMALASTLGAWAGDGPSLLVIDDLQYLDADSHSALRFASRRLSHSDVRIAATRRTGADRALPDESIVRLSGLPAPALHAIIAATLGRRLSRTELESLTHLTGGNPLWALEMVRSGSLDALPASLRSLVEDRVSGLPPACLDRLVDVAVRGRMAVDDADGDTLRPAVREGVLSIDDGIAVFVHPLFAAGVRDAASAGQLRESHRRAASDTDDPESSLLHLARAASGPDRDLAAGLSQAASTTTTSRATALELARRALALTPSDDDARVPRLEQLAVMALAAGTPDSPELVAALLRAAPAGDPRARALLLSARRVDDVAASISAVRLALAEHPLSASTSADLHLGLGGLLLLDGRPAEAALVAAEALDLIDAGSPGWAAAVADTALYRALAAEAVDVEALDRATEIEIGLGPGYRRALMHAVEGPLVVRGLIRAWQDDTEGALRDLVAARGLDGWMEDHAVDFHEAEVRLRRGELADARTLAERSLAYCEDDQEVAAASYALAFACALIGDADAAREAADRGREMSRRSGDALFHAPCDMAEGVLELSLGHGRRAADLLIEAADRMHDIGVVEPSLWPVSTYAAEAAVEAGRKEDAVRISARLEHVHARRPTRWSTAAVVVCRALLLEAEGRLDEAADMLADLDAPSPVDQHRATARRGSLLRRLGRRSAARAHLSAAHDGFLEVGALGFAARSARELARLSGRARGPADTLTPAELRVAHAAAGGARTAEVAASLHLSPRTVEMHLGRIYRKLGVSSRSELVARLAAEPPDGPLAGPIDS